MPSYHLTVSHFSRAKGQSSTAAIAYRGGLRVVDERTGEVHDYTRKQGIVHSELVMPAHDFGGVRDRPEPGDRAAFWNAVEAKHPRHDAITAREVQVSLPAELDQAGRQALAVRLARSLADEYGVAADVSLHAPRVVTDHMLKVNPKQHFVVDPETGERHNGNWHAHIVLSACSVSPDRKLGKKVPELDAVHCQRHKVPNVAERFRERWADMQNEALERAGIEARVDHRSLADQGIEREPTVHLGPAAAGYTRRTGQQSRIALEQAERANERLRMAQIAGAELRQARQNVIDLETALTAALAEREQERAAATRQAQVDAFTARLAQLQYSAGKPLSSPQGPGKQYSGQAVLVERPVGVLVIDHGRELVAIGAGTAALAKIEEGKQVVARSDHAGLWSVELHPRQVELDRRAQGRPGPSRAV